MTADDKKRTEKVKNLAQYVNGLFDEADELFENWKRWSKIELISMLTFLITVFLTNVAMIWLVAFNLWFLILITKNHRIDKPLDKKFGEIKGAFKVLEYLGLIDSPKPRGKKDKKNKRALLEQLKETWGRIKQGVPQLSPQLSMTKNGDI